MGIYQFYARRAKSNGEWIDAAPQLFGFALCNYPTWPNTQQRTQNLTDDYILYTENNILYAAAQLQKTYGNGSYKFCLTNDVNSNYFSFSVTATGNPSSSTSTYFSVNGQSYYGIVSAYYYYGYSGSKAPYAVLSGEITNDSLPNAGTYYAQGTSDLYSLYTVSKPITRAAADAFLTLISLAPGPKPDPDPYEGGGISVVGGGGGDFDTTTENINIPGLPVTTASTTGFITLYNPSVSDLRNLSSYMWANPLFDLSAWKKIFADPMGAILGLSIVPVSIPTAGNAPVTVGNIPTGIDMPLVASQYVIVDCGTIQVKEFWGGYLDYSPYTKADIYLPYCGIHPIDIDDIMGKFVNVVYHIDILSGACCVFVKCDTAILYTFIGQCSSSIPITGDNWTNVINGVLSAAVSVGSMIATGGATAPMAIPQLASTVTNNLKPSIEKSGAMGGTGGLLAYQYPYLIITRPRQALPEDQNKFLGYPSFVTVVLGTLRGYTEVEKVHLENIGATDNELKEIENLLKTGVIF